MEKELKELVEIGRETNKQMGLMAKLIIFTNIVNVITIVVIVMAILK